MFGSGVQCVYSWLWGRDKLPWGHPMSLGGRENHDLVTAACRDYCHILPLETYSSSLSYRCHLWNDKPQPHLRAPCEETHTCGRHSVGWFRPLLPFSCKFPLALQGACVLISDHTLERCLQVWPVAHLSQKLAGDHWKCRFISLNPNTSYQNLWRRKSPF